MVDLVKLRKKQKEKKDALIREQGPGARDQGGEDAVPASGSATGSPEPQASGKKKPKGKAEKTAASHQPEITQAPQLPGPQPPTPGPSSEAPRPSSDKLDRFREQAGKAREHVRAQSAGEEAAAESDANRLELLTFMMAGEQYAIDIERIVEIITPRRTTPVPNAPERVAGIISLRGTLVTMLDLRRELGHGPAGDPGPEARTIVVEDRGGMAGFLVDRVLRVVKVDGAQVQHHPVVNASEQTEAIRGVFRHGSALAIVLDVDRLLGNR